MQSFIDGDLASNNGGESLCTIASLGVTISSKAGSGLRLPALIRNPISAFSTRTVKVSRPIRQGITFALLFR